MRNTAVAAIRLFALSFVLLHIMSVAEAKAQPLDRSLSFQDLAFQLKTPETIARFLWENFAFEDDQRQFGKAEHWQSPEEFLKNHKGDCEDFARFAYEVFKLNGTTAFLLNVYGETFGHTVCVFKENGKYQIIDGTEVRRYDAENLNDLAAQIYPFWETGAIVTPATDSHESVILTQFAKSLEIKKNLSTFA
jgi:hypothetical protein